MKTQRVIRSMEHLEQYSLQTHMLQAVMSSEAGYSLTEATLSVMAMTRI